MEWASRVPKSSSADSARAPCYIAMGSPALVCRVRHLAVILARLMRIITRHANLTAAVQALRRSGARSAPVPFLSPQLFSQEAAGGNC